MSNIVVWFAQSVLGEDRGRGLIDADQLLERIQYEDHRTGVENVIALAGDSDSVETIDRVEDIVRWTLYEHLIQYGIKINVTVAIDRQVLLLQSLYDMEDYNQPDMLLHQLEDEGTPIERFCAVLTLLYGGMVEDYIDDIERVDVDLIDRVQQRMVDQQKVVEAQMPFAIETATQQNTYPDFRKFYRQHQPPRMKNLFDEGWQLGYTFIEYFDQLVDFDQDRQQTIALYYICGALATGETFQQVREYASDRLEPFYSDHQMQQLQKVIQQINDMIEAVAYE